MSKYIPSQFASIIYRPWGNLFKNLTNDQKAEILMAITFYPDYEPKGENFAWDFIKEELDKQYEKFIARKEQAQNAVKQRGTSVNVSQPQLTKGNVSQRPLTSVNHKPEPEPELKPEIDINTHSAEPSADVSVSCKPKKKTASVPKPEDVEQEDWDEYLQLRKSKRAPLTKRALALLRTEGEKAEMTLQEVIVKCLEKSWVGFEAKWVEKEKTAEEESRDYWKIKPIHDWRAEQEAYIKAKREKEDKEGLHHGEAIRRYLNGEAA